MNDYNLAKENAARLLERLTKKVAALLDDYQRRIENFQQVFASNPAYAITWNSEGLVVAQYMAEYARDAASIMADCLQEAIASPGVVDEVSAAKSIELRMAEFREFLQDKINSALRGSSHSTSAYSNAVDRDQLFAASEFHRMIRR